MGCGAICGCSGRIGASPDFVELSVRPLRYILLAWGITWLPVALIATGDVMASSDGPFNFPMSMFAVPLFAFFCLVEAGIIILLHRYSMSWSPKVNLTAQKLKDK